jgi:hypothetical protein
MPNGWRGIMRRKIHRLALLAVVMGGLLVAVSVPASAAGAVQISGVGVYETTGECGPPPAGFDTYPGLIMTGSLEGCLFTGVLTATDHGAPSGIYQETGQEMFVGSLNGGPLGTFTTTYKFESKWTPDVTTGVEFKGRCQHPIVAGSGSGGFAGATGRLDFKDEVTTGQYFYRGHITLG